MRGVIPLFVTALGIGSFAVSAAQSSPNDDCVNNPQNRQCWSGPWGQFDINTDYYQHTPDTGEIVEVINFAFHCSYFSIGLLLTTLLWHLMASKRKCTFLIIRSQDLLSKQIGETPSSFT
jgi:hypothetical protein